MKTFITGPDYARRLVTKATDAGAHILTEAMVTGWHDEYSLDVTSPQGRLTVDARAIILATGARERPRPARLIPGDRPAGVYTTGQLQNLVHLHAQAGGSTGRDRRRRAGQLVGRTDPQTRRLPHRVDDHHLRQSGVLRGVQHRREVTPDGRRRRHPHPRGAHHRQTRADGRRGRARRHRCAPHRRMRHPGADRRLDPRPRTRPLGGPRDGPCHSGAR